LSLIAAFIRDSLLKKQIIANLFAVFEQFKAALVAVSSASLA